MLVFASSSEDKITLADWESTTPIVRARTVGTPQNLSFMIMKDTNANALTVRLQGVHIFAGKCLPVRT